MQSFSKREVVLYDGWMRKFSELNVDFSRETPFHTDYCNDELSAVIQVPGLFFGAFLLGLSTVRACVHACGRAYFRACARAFVHAFVRACVRAYVRASYVCACVFSCVLSCIVLCLDHQAPA